MRFLTIFKTPKYKRFQYEPRYYDPVKERIKARTLEIKAELEGRTAPGYEDRIRRGLRMGKKSSTFHNTTQLMFIGVFLLAFYAYLQVGNSAIYVLAAILGLYVLAKKRKLI